MIAGLTMPGATAAGRDEEDAAGRVSVVTDLGTIASEWRALEAEAICSPYGRQAWVAAMASAMAAEGRVAAIVARTPAGRLDVVLPVSVRRRGLARIAFGFGGKHANYVVPTIRRGTRWGRADELDGLLRVAGRQLGIDAFAFINVPRDWDGCANPLAGGGAPNGSDATSLRLEPDLEDTLKRSMSNDARKKLRNKQRQLARLGPVSLLRAERPEEVDAVLTAFFRQKTARFEELGIADPFADDAIRAALRAGALASDEDGPPPIELRGLQVGDDIVATFGAAGTADRLSGMFLSFDGEHPAARCSPGELLVVEILREQVARGRTIFDLGVGEARYKRTICDGVDPLVERIVPVTALGRGYATAGRTWARLRRLLKSDPRAMAALAGARRVKAALRRR